MTRTAVCINTRFTALREFVWVYNPITDDENFTKQSKAPGTKGICDDQPIAHPAPYLVVGQDGVFGVVAS